MARTTRSAAAHQDKREDEPEKPNDVSPPMDKAKVPSKKRKRTSGLSSDDLPVSKQPRSDDEETTVKEEDVQVPEYPPLAGDLFIEDEGAQKILDILEMIDTQGLLDRVFPLDDVFGPTATPATSKLQSDSFSLRTLLKDSSKHPLRVYKSAIKHLFPISSQPRSRISPPAAQQLRFCQLALSLVDQASHQTIDGLSLRPELILPDHKPDDDALSSFNDGSSAAGLRRKYALVQKLPNGEWWTSLNTELPGAEADGKVLTDFGTAHAELVAVLPSPSVSSSSKSPPTLGEIVASTSRKTPVPTKMKLPGPRRVSCGSFLDYGPYASFAPVFESDGADVGRVGVSSVLWGKYVKGKTREKARILGQRMREKIAASEQKGMAADGAEEVDPGEAREAERQKQKEKQMELLGSILTHEESTTVMKAYDALELEENVSDLLRRNASALLRLEELQKQRLGGVKGGSSTVKIGSEEWDIAQKVMNALTALASMRPRLSASSTSAIVPPASVLRALHHTLPSEPTEGWYGTLTESRGAALRDDTTIHLKSSPIVQAPAPTPAAATPAAQNIAAAATTYSPAQTYAQQNYSYSGYAQQYRGYYTGGYAQSAGASAQGQAGAAATSTYPQYGSTSQYPYTSWYANYQHTGTLGTGSGRGTPQSTAIAPAPAVAPSSALGTTYPSYGAGTSPTPARAVANTVAAAKPQINGWATPVAPTLPPHLRPSGASSASPVTPGPSYGGYTTQNYGYQASSTT